MRQENGITIGVSPGRPGDTERDGAGNVLDNHLLLECGAHCASKIAGQHIGRPTGCEQHDDRDRSVRIVLRPRDYREESDGALMQEIALDCGYPASSLKERVYALSSSRGGEFDRCGLLIYTASADAQGTLGGLVGVAPRFSNILAAALRRAEICSNDPICADHEPDNRSGDRATHGAACHGCLLIAETSCESRNLFLDRALLVPTMAEDKFAFFK
jgi:hypothetical protein